MRAAGVYWHVLTDGKFCILVLGTNNNISHYHTSSSPKEVAVVSHALEVVFYSAFFGTFFMNDDRTGMN